YVSMPAESSGNFRIRLVSPDGRHARDVLAQTTTISQLSWSPDGKSIAYGSRNGTTGMIGVVDVATGATHWLPSTANGGTPIWTKDGLVFASAGGAIRIGSLDGKSVRTLVPKSDGSPAVSRDGGSIAFLNNDLGA